MTKVTNGRRIHKKSDGLLLIEEDGSARFLTFLESLRNRITGGMPRLPLGVVDCSGPSPCTACPDKRQCAKTGCVQLSSDHPVAQH